MFRKELRGDDDGRDGHHIQDYRSVEWASLVSITRSEIR
jgi:hypothetical protein